MDIHDGQISVASDGEGRGCSFTVKLPMLRYPNQEVLARNSYVPDSLQYQQPLPVFYPPVFFHSSSMDLSGSHSACFPDTAPKKENDLSLRLPSLTSPDLDLDLDPSPVKISLETCVPQPVPLSMPLSMPTYNVLVVDDSDLNRKMLIKCLEAEHHVCEYAADGFQAIKKVQDRMHWNVMRRKSYVGKPYDVILMDSVVSFFSVFYFCICFSDLYINKCIWSSFLVTAWLDINGDNDNDDDGDVWLDSMLIMMI
jgi:hypothetical protein